MSKCPRCTKQVYFAEQVRANGQIWHKHCLTCAICRSRLDSTTCRDHDTEIYCTSCHGKNFGPKGYGFAGGASGLSMDTGRSDCITTENVPVGLSLAQVPQLFKQSWPVTGSNQCPRCGKSVYVAEKIIGPGQYAYHKMCFKCTDCNKLLDSSTIAEKECVIYCKGCHNKNFGPKGFGFGQAMQRTT